jgi:ubiquinone/menaquinone biosynthesis C-methylase UbiE
VKYDAAAAAAFYDEYGEREWTRFEDGRTPAVSVATHTAYLHRYVRPGNRALDAGCGPGRFTIELARLGARVVAVDFSPGQLDLHRRHVGEAGADAAVEERIVADVSALPFADAAFEVTVCYGGALSYLLERADEGAAELARVTRPGGHLLVSVMALVGITVQSMRSGMLVGRGYSPADIEQIVATGVLPRAASGHPAMKLFRWRELAEILHRHGEIVAVTATGIFTEEGELAEHLELDLGAETGAIDAGSHILAVVQIG